MSADDLKPLLSGREVCKALGVSHATLRAWVADGTFPAVNVNGRIRYSQDAIEAMYQRAGHLAAESGRGSAA